MTKQNFFIVGAAKCRTTSLYEYLCQHTDIFMSEGKYKEPHFFRKDISAQWFIRDETANKNRTARRHWLKRLLQNQHSSLATLRDHLPMCMQSRANTILGSLHTIEWGRSPHDKTIHTQPTKDFCPDIDHLGIIIDRDLSTWK